MPLTNYPNGLTSFGVPLLPTGNLFSGTSRAFFCDPTNGNDGNDGLSPQSAVKTLAQGQTLLTANSHDILYLIGTVDFASLAATLVWNKAYTHLIGVCAPTFENQRARISCSADFTPAISVTAQGCLFMNLYLAYGRGNAANVNAISVSAGRNAFLNCNFSGPQNAAEAGAATYATLKLTGATECYFGHCTIGVTTIPQSTTNTQILFVTGSGRVLFEDCDIVNMNSTATALLVKNTATDGIVDYVEFRRCNFLSFSANWATPLTGAIANADGNSGGIVVKDCAFTGCVKIGAAGFQNRTFVSSTSSTAATTGLAVNPS